MREKCSTRRNQQGGFRELLLFCSDKHFKFFKNDEEDPEVPGQKLSDTRKYAQEPGVFQTNKIVMLQTLNAKIMVVFGTRLIITLEIDICMMHLQRRMAIRKYAAAKTVIL